MNFIFSLVCSRGFALLRVRVGVPVPWSDWKSPESDLKREEVTWLVPP